MSVSRFRTVAAIVTEAEEADIRLQLSNSAFIGWQVLSAMGAEVGSFDQYLARLGLA